MVGVRQTRGDNICIPDNGSHLDYLGHTCLGFFCALHGGVSTWSGKGPRGLYYHPGDNRTPCANNQKALSRPARGKTARCSRWLFDILCFLFDCFLIVCLLLFALNVLMLLVGGNRTPESDYLSAPLTNSTFILYLSFLITWVPIPFVGNIDWASISLSDDKSAPSLHLNHQRSFRRGKCLNLWNLCNLI